VIAIGGDRPLATSVVTRDGWSFLVRWIAECPGRGRNDRVIRARGEDPHRRPWQPTSRFPRRQVTPPFRPRKAPSPIRPFKWSRVAVRISLRPAVLGLDLLDRDDDREGQRLVDIVRDLDPVRVVHAEP
jgi:hypothetical protein